MNKNILQIVRVLCLFVVGSFFLSFFVISCNGHTTSYSGYEVAVGKEDEELEANPLLFLIPGIALMLLLLLFNSSIHEKMISMKTKITLSDCITIIASIIGLVLFAIVYDKAIGAVARELGASIKDISPYFHTGLGFKIGVGSYIAMFILPIADVIIRQKFSATAQQGSPSDE